MEGHLHQFQQVKRRGHRCCAMCAPHRPPGHAALCSSRQAPKPPRPLRSAALQLRQTSCPARALAAQPLHRHTQQRAPPCAQTAPCSPSTSRRTHPPACTHLTTASQKHKKTHLPTSLPAPPPANQHPPASPPGAAALPDLARRRSPPRPETHVLPLLLLLCLLHPQLPPTPQQARALLPLQGPPGWRRAPRQWQAPEQPQAQLLLLLLRALPPPGQQTQRLQRPPLPPASPCAACGRTRSARKSTRKKEVGEELVLLTKKGKRKNKVGGQVLLFICVWWQSGANARAPRPRMQQGRPATPQRLQCGAPFHRRHSVPSGSASGAAPPNLSHTQCLHARPLHPCHLPKHMCMLRHACTHTGTAHKRHKNAPKPGPQRGQSSPPAPAASPQWGASSLRAAAAQHALR